MAKRKSASKAQPNRKLHFAVAVDPPEQSLNQWMICYAIAAILGIVALSKLIVFVQYAASLEFRGIEHAAWAAAFIIFIELLSIPCLLKIPLSRAFRGFSSGALLLAAISWLVIALQLGHFTGTYNYAVIGGDVLFLIWAIIMFPRLNRQPAKAKP